MVVRYLVELHKSTVESNRAYKPININCFYEYGFRWACKNGHYLIIRYLVNCYANILYRNDSTYKPININSWDEEGFRWACGYGHYKVVRYLLNITKKHKYYKPFNNYLMAFKKIDIFLL